MATRRNLCKVTLVAGAAGAAVLARFLINDLSGQTGPGWTIVEAYDASHASDKRRTPTAADEGNMDNAAFAAGGDFAWAVNTAAVNAMAAGDWIVLQSAHVTNKFQLHIRVVSTTSISMMIFALGGFATGGADTTTPTLPAGAIGTNTTTLTAFTVPLAAAYLSVVADEEMVAFLFDDLVSAAVWGYVGQIDGARSFMSPTDDRPYVISNVSNAHVLTTASFSRISPVDDSTGLVSGLPAPVILVSNGAAVHVQANYDGLGGGYAMLPVGVLFTDASHIHFAGWLRYSGTVHLSLGTSGTGAAKAFMYRNTSVGTRPAVAMLWDSTAEYP